MRALKIAMRNWLKGRAWAQPFMRRLRLRRAAKSHFSILQERFQIRSSLGSRGEPREGVLYRTLSAARPKDNDARGGFQSVLIATSTGGHHAMAPFEQALGAALSLRGAETSFLLCDGALPACMLCDFTHLRGRFLKGSHQTDLCPSCFAPAAEALAALGLPLHRYGAYLTPDDHTKAARWAESADLDNAIWEGINLGEQALAGVMRFFGHGDISAMPNGERVARRYLEAARLTAVATRRLLTERKPDTLVLHHGVYVPQGVIVEVARQLGIRVVTWHFGYRKNTVIFSEGDTYHRTMITEPQESWRGMEWNAEKDAALTAYLASRERGGQDWIWFHERPLEDAQGIARRLKLDPEKPTIGLLTNVIWDAQLHYPNNAYPTMMEWLVDTVEFFRCRNDLQLVIRVHPAEIYGNVPTRQPVEAELKRRFGQLPENIKLVPPRSPIGTYALMELCDSALVYSTKTAIELAARGMPVIVAGEAWVRGKGFTLDAANQAEYRAILETLPLGRRLTPAQTELARRYAHHFFFRRMIPLKLFGEGFAVRATEEALLPGACAGLDAVCEGILKGTPFMFDAPPHSRRSA